MPVLAVLAENSIIHDSELGARRGQALVRHITISVKAGATHSLPMESPDEIGRDILDFAADSDRSERAATVHGVAPPLPEL